MDFRLPLTSGSIVTIFTELLDVENVGVAVEMSLLSYELRYTLFHINVNVRHL